MLLITSTINNAFIKGGGYSTIVEEIANSAVYGLIILLRTCYTAQSFPLFFPLRGRWRVVNRVNSW